MARRTIPPRRVEALASECRALRVWLEGPGRSAGPESFAVALQAYRALIDAVAFLPRGPQFLQAVRALPAVHRQPKGIDTTRAAESFTDDELAVLPARLLTPTGWVVPVPLVARVDAERVALGPTSTSKDALRTILLRAGRSPLQAERELGRWEKELSLRRARVSANAGLDGAVTGPDEKVPPDTV